MNTLLWCLLLGGVIGSSVAQAAETTIGIRVYNYARTDRQTLVRAEKTVENIVGHAAIQVIWLDYDPNAEQDGKDLPGCVPHLILDILPKTMSPAYHLPEDRLGVTPGQGA